MNEDRDRSFITYMYPGLCERGKRDKLCLLGFPGDIAHHDMQQCSHVEEMQFDMNAKRIIPFDIHTGRERVERKLFTL